MRVRGVIWGAILLPAVACGVADEPASNEALDRAKTSVPPRETLARTGAADDASGTALFAPAAPPSPDRSAQAPAAHPAPTPLPPLLTDTAPTAPAMLIRTGTASVRIDSLESAIPRVRALAGQLGGYVANTSMQVGTAQHRSASLEVKVPAARFDDLLTGLTPIGTVESTNVTAEDVGEEYVDVNARAANARRLEARLVDLLANRTGRLKDVLDIERELARVREEIERLEGRLRYLKTRSALSTLLVTLHEPIPVVGEPGTSVLAEAFKQAWRNFVSVVAGGIAALGILVPLALVGGTVVVLVRRRWRRAKSGPPAAALTGPTPSATA